MSILANAAASDPLLFFVIASLLFFLLRRKLFPFTIAVFLGLAVLGIFTILSR